MNSKHPHLTCHQKRATIPKLVKTFSKATQYYQSTEEGELIGNEFRDHHLNRQRDGSTVLVAFMLLRFDKRSKGHH